MSSQSSGISTGAVCSNIQGVIQNSCSVNARDKNGFTDGVLMAQRAGINPLNIGFQQDGSSRVLRVKYMPRLANTASGKANICDTASSAKYLGTDITQDMLMSESVEQEFNLDDIRPLCETPAEFRGYIFNSMFNELWKKINKKNLDYINTITPYLPVTHGAGQFNLDLVQGTDPNEQISIREYNKVRRGLENMGCGTKFFWIGQSDELDVAVTKLRLGCCDYNGLDLNMMNQDFFYLYDSQMNTALGTNHTIAMNMGAMQIMPYYENAGAYSGEFQGGALIKESVVDPITNMRFDMNIYETACPDITIRIQFAFNWYLFTLPDDLYVSGDSLYQTKGFLRPIVA